MQIPFSPPDMTEAEEIEVAQVLRSDGSPQDLAQKNLNAKLLHIAIRPKSYA